MVNKVDPKNTHLRNDLSAIPAAPELVQLASRVASTAQGSDSAPPPFLAHSVLSRGQTSSSSSSSSSSEISRPTKVRSDWEGIHSSVRSSISQIVADIEKLEKDQIAALENPSEESTQFIKALPDTKKKIANRMKNRRSDVMRYIGRDEVLDLTIKFIVKFSRITITQKQSANGGRPPKLFHNHESFLGWIKEIQENLKGDQLRRFLKEAVEPFSEVSVERKALKESLGKIKDDLVNLLQIAQFPPANRDAEKNRKFVNTKKDLFAQRANALVERITPHSADPEILDLIEGIGRGIKNISEWQTSTQKPSKKIGAIRIVRSFPILCPQLNAILLSNRPSVQVANLPTAQNVMTDRINHATKCLKEFTETNKKWFAMDKKSLAKPEHQDRVDTLKLAGRQAKQDFARNGALGKYLKSKSLNPVEEAPLADLLATVYNEISAFQARCPRAHNILGFYDTFPDYAESLRDHLNPGSAVLAPSPPRGLKSKRPRQEIDLVNSSKEVRTKKPAVVSDSESESSDSSSSSSDSTSESSSESSSSSSDSSSESEVVAPSSKRRRLASSQPVSAKQAPATPMVVESDPVDHQEIEDEPMEATPLSGPPINLPPVQTVSLGERYKNLLIRLQRQNLIPGFPVRDVWTQEELVLDKLDFFELHFKKTHEEKMGIISSHIQVLKNMLREVCRSNEPIEQKRAFLYQIASNFNEVITRMSKIELRKIEEDVAGFAEALNPLIIEDMELRKLFGKRSFAMLFPTVTNSYLEKGDEALLRRIFSAAEAKLISL